jgi:hypothetical protein
MERTGWLFMAVILVAGLLGVFGHHPLSRATGRTARRLTVEYDRFARYQSNVELRVLFEPGTDGSNLVALWFDPDYLDCIKVVAVSPLPVRGEARDEGRGFVFQTDGSRFTATVSVQFETAGLVRGRVWADHGQPLRMSHMVWRYPNDELRLRPAVDCQ